MLNKEEIESCKKEARDYIKFMETAGDNAGWTRGIIWYIEQLENKVKEYEPFRTFENFREEITKNKKREVLEEWVYEIGLQLNLKDQKEQELINKLKEIINNEDMSDVEYQFKRELAIEILNQIEGGK